MKNKIYLIILIMIIGVVGKCYGQLEIRIDNVKDSWVLGEDYLIKIHMKNTSDKVMKVIYSLKSLDSIRMDIEPKEGIKKERGLIIDRRSIKCPVASAKVIGRYEPGWEHKKIIAISYFHILEKAGRYRIKLIYESKDYKRYSEIYEKIGKETIVTPISEVILGPVESNEIILEIKEPEGIDKQAYEEFKGYPRAYGKELLEKYPTSTYAGWELKQRGPYPFLAGGKNLIDDLLLPYNKRKGYQGSVDENDNSKWITPEEKARIYETYAEQFLSFHADEDISLIIRMRLAMAKAVLHKWQEAYEAAEKSLSKEWPELFLIEAPNMYEGWRKTLFEFKEELIKRGLAKAK